MFLPKFFLVSVLLSLSALVECKHNFAKDLGNFAEAIGNFFSAVDDCKFTCSNGVRPIVNPSHRPSADGCGSYGVQFKIDSVPGATECCNKHDYCYDTCNSDKSECDKRLNHCLQHICYELEAMKLPQNKVKECVTVVQYIFGGVSAIGCEAYQTAQKAACSCQSKQRGFKRSQYRYLHNDI